MRMLKHKQGERWWWWDSRTFIWKSEWGS